MEKQKNRFDTVIWIATVALILIAVFFDRYFSEIVVALRIAGWIVLACALVFMVMKTSQGKRFWAFAKEARIELRKITWPKREETVRTTFLVIGLVIIAALLIWGIDSVLLKLIGWLTGQRG